VRTATGSREGSPRPARRDMAQPRLNWLGWLDRSIDHSNGARTSCSGLQLAPGTNRHVFSLPVIFFGPRLVSRGQWWPGAGRRYASAGYGGLRLGEQLSTNCRQNLPRRPRLCAIIVGPASPSGANINRNHGNPVVSTSLAPHQSPNKKAAQPPPPPERRSWG